MHNTIKDLPYDDRPYEKCIKYGPKVLSDAELISVILKTGTREKSSIELARQILTDSDNRINLLYLFRKSTDELLQINGIGISKAVTLKCISEISERIYSLSVSHETVLNNPCDVAKLYMERMRHLNYEIFIVLFLNAASERITEREISRGTVNSTIVSPREIFIMALNIGAVKIILLHNHPSGNPQASENDILITKKICDAGKVLDIPVLDHIIIGDKRYISFKEQKLID